MLQASGQRLASTNVLDGFKSGVMIDGRRASGLLLPRQRAGTAKDAASASGAVLGSSVAISRVSCRNSISSATASTSASAVNVNDDATQISAEAKALGLMIGAMCGNALGAPLEHSRHWQIIRQHSNGVLDFWPFDFGHQSMACGQYTGAGQLVGIQLIAEASQNSPRLAETKLAGPSMLVFLPVSRDFESMLSVARSLADVGIASARHQAYYLAIGGNAHARRYSHYGSVLLDALQHGSTNIDALPRLAEGYLAATIGRGTQTSTDRVDREPHGPADYSAAARVAPVGFLYRDAPLCVLLEAAAQSCRCSHNHPVGQDGAAVIVAAVAWLSVHQPGDPAATPQALLTHLLGVCTTHDMELKLRLLQAQLFQVQHVTDWHAFLCGSNPRLGASVGWHRLVSVFSALTHHGYATAGTEAAAVALWALVTHWHQPEQAVIIAATFGGVAPATAQMTGAMAGALHGESWIPMRWQDGLEGGEGGRDAVRAVAQRLAGQPSPSCVGSDAEDYGVDALKLGPDVAEEQEAPARGDLRGS